MTASRRLGPRTRLHPARRALVLRLQVAKFFALLYPLLLLYHKRVPKNDPAGRPALRTREDVQNLVEDRLAAVPPMRDNNRRQLMSLTAGWWTIVRGPR